MTLNDIGKAMRSVLSAMVRAAWGITLCAGGLAVGIAGEILLGMLNFMFGILTALLSVVAAKRHSKTVAQQCRYYEVDNIFEYMVEVCINGNFSSFRRLYHELNKEARKDFIAFLILECPPQYHIEILQKTV